MPDAWWKCTAWCCKAVESLLCLLFGHDWTFPVNVWRPIWCARCGVSA